MQYYLYMFAGLIFVSFYERYAGNGLPPIPVCALVSPPLVNAEGKASIHPHTLTPYKFQFPFLPRYTVSTLMVLVFPVLPLMGPPVRTTLSPGCRPRTFFALAMAW